MKVLDGNATLCLFFIFSQGAGLGNQKLLLRFPNNPPPGSYIPENNTTQTSTTSNNTKNKTWV